MHRKFIAAISAAAIVITAIGASPAAAGDRDTARVLATVLGIAVLGKLLHDRNTKDDDKQVTRRYSDPIPTYRPVERPTTRLKPRPLPRRIEKDRRHRDANRKLLPKQCFRSYDTRRGSVYMFGRRCLENNYRYSNRLPKNCAQRVRTRDGNRAGYDARCLRREGYSLARG